MDEQNDNPRIEPNFPASLFEHWQSARRGSLPAQDLSNPVWEWLFRSRVDPYHAALRFESQGEYPRWAGCRMGRSKTQLSDGRVIWVAGEHEDIYDPDFYIYNDVIVEYPDSTIQILGYPESVFPPTDFQSATAINDDSVIVMIGRLGYSRTWQLGSTPIYSLDTQSYQVTEISAQGTPPGWLFRHKAELSQDGKSIAVRQGEVWTSEGIIENIDEWSLCLGSWTWKRLTDRKWPRFQIRRSDMTRLHLFEYGCVEFDLECLPRKQRKESFSELTKVLGIAPNLDAYRRLFRPSVEHQLVKPIEESANDWRTTRMVVDEVTVRIADDSEYLTVTFEGDLKTDIQNSIIEELVEKLQILENSSCTFRRIGAENP